jgi:hypothetical protein
MYIVLVYVVELSKGGAFQIFGDTTVGQLHNVVLELVRTVTPEITGMRA